MSTIKAINVQHPSSATINVVNDASGNVAVGGTLTAAGVIQSTSGGIKFPDNTTQTTAAAASSGINVQTFTSSGTWTKPSLAAGSRAFIQAWGGGGSGSKGTSNGGGAGGGYNERWVTLSAMGTTETITIGSGGAAVTVNGLGNSGGTTTVGSLCPAYGGDQGNGSGAAYGGSQLSAGQPWAGLIVNSGQSGWNWGGMGCSSSSIGSSGSSVWGGGAGGYSGNTTAGTSSFAGAGGAGGTTGSGAAGTAPSGGGGGTATGASSGAGGAGQVIITVFPA